MSAVTVDISDGLLFPVVESLSPRIAWMRRHGVITFYCAPGRCPAVWLAGFQRWWPELGGVDFFAQEAACNGDSRLGEGDTEEDALVALARAAGLRLWNEEEAW